MKEASSGFMKKSPPAKRAQGFITKLSWRLLLSEHTEKETRGMRAWPLNQQITAEDLKVVKWRLKRSRPHLDPSQTSAILSSCFLYLRPPVKW